MSLDTGSGGGPSSRGGEGGPPPKRDRTNSEMEWCFHEEFIELLRELERLCNAILRAPNDVRTEFGNERHFLTGFFELVDNPFLLYHSEGRVAVYVFDPFQYINHFHAIVTGLHYVTWAPSPYILHARGGELPSKDDVLPTWDHENLYYFSIVVYRLHALGRKRKVPSDVLEVIVNLRDKGRFVDAYELLSIFYHQLRSMLQRAKDLVLKNRVAEASIGGT